jgi:hypothetical protein
LNCLCCGNPDMPMIYMRLYIVLIFEFVAVVESLEFDATIAELNFLGQAASVVLWH